MISSLFQFSLTSNKQAFDSFVGSTDCEVNLVVCIHMVLLSAGLEAVKRATARATETAAPIVLFNPRLAR